MGVFHRTIGDNAPSKGPFLSHRVVVAEGGAWFYPLTEADCKPGEPGAAGTRPSPPLREISLVSSHGLRTTG